MVKENLESCMEDMIIRAKTLDGVQWVSGYYVKHINRQLCPMNDHLRLEDVDHYIFIKGLADWNMPTSLMRIQIDPSTICRYTGYTDSKGMRIFENDVVTAQHKGRSVFYPNVMDTGRIERRKPGSTLMIKTLLREQESMDEFTNFIILGNSIDSPTIFESLSKNRENTIINREGE